MQVEAGHIYVYLYCIYDSQPYSNSLFPVNHTVTAIKGTVLFTLYIRDILSDQVNPVPSQSTNTCPTSTWLNPALHYRKQDSSMGDNTRQSVYCNTMLLPMLTCVQKLM